MQSASRFSLAIASAVIPFSAAARGQCGGVPTDRFEENDTCLQAVTLPEGFHAGLTLFVDDPDYYELCVAPGSTLEIDVHFADNVLAVQARLAEPCDGPAVGSFSVNVDLLHFEYTNTTSTTRELSFVVFHHPTIQLLPCGFYDLEVTGSTTCPIPATSFCAPAGVNSSGASAELSANLSSGVGSGLHLEATSGPPNAFGYCLVSAGFVEPGGTLGQGRLCLTNPVGRYNGVQGPLHNSIGAFDASGRFQNLSGTSTTGFGFDVPSLVPLIGATIQAGDSWHFQLWYRDQFQGAPTVNFTQGVSVTF